VVALGDATRRVRDGQRITIDGSTGLLELLE
jgi:phosphohistidine swiveling domain-containing protein